MKVTLNKTLGDYMSSDVFEFDMSIPEEKELAEKMIDYCAKDDNAEVEE